MKEVSEVSFLDIKENKEYIKLIKTVLQQAFSIEKIEKTNLYINIILTNSINIRSINKQYRNINKETDVLSFPMFEKNEIEDIKNNGSNIRDVLGDIVISIPKVKEQAKEYEHSFERELSYMLIHGFYHLLGYDHIDPKDKITMRKKEEYILTKLNITR